MSDHLIRLKKLNMLSCRRGMKELDLILSQFADEHLPNLNPSELDQYEKLLEEDDPLLLSWFMSQSAAPDKYKNILKKISI